MDEKDKANFGELMMGVGVMYKQSISQILLTLYWNGLKRFEFERVYEAINAHINNPDSGQYMPKIADVVRYLEGNFHTQALQAWSKLTQAIGRFGMYESLVFDDPIIHIVVMEMGGWIALCRATVSELSFRAHEFEKRYVDYITHPPKIYPKQLTGICEQINRLNGFTLPPPIFLGEATHALITYEKGHESAALPYLTATPQNIQTISALTTNAITTTFNNSLQPFRKNQEK